MLVMVCTLNVTSRPQESFENELNLLETSTNRKAFPKTHTMFAFQGRPKRMMIVEIDQRERCLCCELDVLDRGKETLMFVIENK